VAPAHAGVEGVPDSPLAGAAPADHQRHAVGAAATAAQADLHVMPGDVDPPRAPSVD